MATLDRLAPPPSPSLPAGTAWSLRRAIAAAVTAAAAIAVLQVVQSSGFAYRGQTLANLDQERINATARVHDLEAEVAALSSLDRVERAARERLAMVPATSVTYLQVGVPAPSDPLLPRPIVALRPAPTSDKTPWWQRVLRITPFF